MSDTLHDDLTDLASSVRVPPLDFDGLVRGARRRRARGAAATVVAVVVTSALVVGAAAWQPGAQSLRPADPRPSGEQPSGLLVPSKTALEQALDAFRPGSRIVTAQEWPESYLPPGSSAFAGRMRLGRVDATVRLRGGTGLSIQWDLLDDPLSDEEAARFVDDRLAHDTAAPDPEQLLLKQEDGSRSGLRIWRIEETDQHGDKHAFLRLAAWASNGVNLVISRTAPPDSEQPPATEEMIGLARILTDTASTDGRTSHGRAGPFAVTWVPQGVEFRRNSTAPATDIAGDAGRGLYLDRWEGINNTNGRQLAVNVATLGGTRARALLARALDGPNNPRRVTVRGRTGVLAAGSDTVALSLVDGPDYVQVVGARGTATDDLLRVAAGLARPTPGPLAKPLAAFAASAQGTPRVGCVTPGLALILASRDYTRDRGPDGKVPENEIVVRVITEGPDPDGGANVRRTTLYDGTTGLQITSFKQSLADNLPPLDALRADEIPCPAPAPAGHG
jgi:hypothetical protein